MTDPWIATLRAAIAKSRELCAQARTIANEKRPVKSALSKQPAKG